MSAAEWQPVLAAAIALLVAIAGYLTARVQQNTRAIDEHGPQIAAAQIVAAAASQAASRPPAGGGAVQNPYPLWNQLADPLPTGALPQWRYEECGEECVAEVLYRQHGVSVIADSLRYQLGGPGRRGLTSGEDLVRLLGLNNVAAQLQEPDAAAAPAVLQHTTAAGRAAIALGGWVTPGVLHWVLVTRADAAGCGYNDPWGGTRKAVTWTDFRARYAGELVVVTRAPDSSG